MDKLTEKQFTQVNWISTQYPGDNVFVFRCEECETFDKGMSDVAVNFIKDHAGHNTMVGARITL